MSERLFGAAYALLVTAALAGAGWTAVELVGYPSPPPRPAAVRGDGFRAERGHQHLAHLSGDAYALGFHNSRLFPELMFEQEDALVDALFAFTRSAAGAVLVRHMSLLYLAGLDRYLTSDEREEILGLAEGAPDPFPELGPRYARLASYHALHELSQRFAFDNPLFACSVVAVGGERGRDGHAFLARNFDFEGGEIFDKDKLVLAVRPAQGHGFVSIAWSGMAGVVSGMNDAGLAITINAGAASDYNRVGAPTTLLVRRALQHDATIAQAVRTLTAAPRFVTDIIGLADRTGAVAVLELTPNRSALRQGPLLAATNHLESPALADDRVNRERQGQTTTVPRRQRLARLLEEATGPLGPAELLAILRDRKAEDGAALPVGHRHALDALIATHSVIFDATQGVVWVSEGPHAAGAYYGYDVAGLVAATTPEEMAAAFRDDLPADPIVPEVARVAAGRASWHRAQAALARGDVRTAERALAQVPPILAPHPTTLTLAGDLAEAEGDRARATLLWRRALEAPPEYLAEVARLHAKLGE